MQAANEQEAVGFGVTEVLVALVVLTIAAFAMSELVAIVSAATADTQARRHAQRAARSVAETALAAAVPPDAAPAILGARARCSTRAVPVPGQGADWYWIEGTCHGREAQQMGLLVAR